jgi:hypothetical protein
MTTMPDRPGVDLNLIRKQLSTITEYLKANVWRKKDAIQKDDNNTQGNKDE